MRPHHQQDKTVIQLPKIIIQPGPSPFSGRKRVTTPDSAQQQQSMIFLDKTTPDLNQTHIQLYQ
jgi:hypothetical protein